VSAPGGGVAASEEIYREVKRIRDGEKDGVKKKLIVASIETVGASGAYYIASATNKIYVSHAYGDGARPVIHVFTVTLGGGGVTTAPSAPTNVRLVG
jgi:protease-4